MLNNNEDLTENINELDSTPNNQVKSSKSNTVKLMTIHSSKGLEFNSVFIVGVEKNYYPLYHPSTKDTKKHEEEERRMFYVAITRAKKNCFISYALNRLMDSGKLINRKKSQFINELENKCLDFSGDYDNQDEDNILSFNKSSFKQHLHNNNNYQNNNNWNNKSFLNQKRYNFFQGFKYFKKKKK